MSSLAVPVQLIGMCLPRQILAALRVFSGIRGKASEPGEPAREEFRFCGPPGLPASVRGAASLRRAICTGSSGGRAPELGFSSRCSIARPRAWSASVWKFLGRQPPRERPATGRAQSGCPPPSPRCPRRPTSGPRASAAQQGEEEPAGGEGSRRVPKSRVCSRLPDSSAERCPGPAGVAGGRQARGVGRCGNELERL